MQVDQPPGGRPHLLRLNRKQVSASAAEAPSSGAALLSLGCRLSRLGYLLAGCHSPDPSDHGICTMDFVRSKFG